MTEPVSLRIGGRDIIAPTTEDDERFITMVLWGPSGHGKSELANTAPGDKLWLLTDPDGEAAIPIKSKRGYNHFIRLYEEKDDVVLGFRSTDPFGIEKMLRDRPEIQTIILDSLTTLSEMALNAGVVEAKKTPKGRTSTIEDPGFAGYNHKKVYVTQTYKNMLGIAKRLGRHMIFTGHEDKPDTNDKGEFVGITLILGSSLIQELPVRISEIWHVTDMGNKNGVPQHRIAIRPSRGRSPMRTRMFETNGDVEFMCTYDAQTNKGDGIAEWYARWEKGGFVKLPLPK